MASTLQPLTPLPTPKEPVIDQKTGLMTLSWYRYFKLLDSHIREVEQRISDLETP